MCWFSRLVGCIEFVCRTLENTKTHEKGFDAKKRLRFQEPFFAGALNWMKLNTDVDINNRNHESKRPSMRTQGTRRSFPLIRQMISELPTHHTDRYEIRDTRRGCHVWAVNESFQRVRVPVPKDRSSLIREIRFF